MRTWRCKPVAARRWSGAVVLGAGAVLVMLAAAYLWVLGGPVPPQAAPLTGAFALQTMDGRPVTDRSFPGRFLLIYFGYTECRDVCPTTLRAVAAALAQLGPRGDAVQPLFITVDPLHDTQAVLRRALAAFSPRILGLTGTPAQIAQARQAYRIDAIVHPPTPGTADAVIDHSSVLFLAAPDRRTIVPIPADAPDSVIASTIARHLN